MHEVNELVRFAAPVATMGGVAAMAVIRAREARRSRRTAAVLAPVDAEAVVGGNSKAVGSKSSGFEASQESR
jgi:hypothetical protein